MTKRFIGKMKKMLLEEKKAILYDYEGTAAAQIDKVELACDASNNNVGAHYVHLKLNRREQLKLQKIDEALWRIKDGTFGICDECGEPIAQARLEVIPHTLVCVVCQKEAEAAEKFQVKTGDSIN